MDDIFSLPGALSNLASVLEPYIKPRQETTRIRRLLRLHLNSCLQIEDHQFLNRPLSLPNVTHCEQKPPQMPRGLHREYLEHVGSYVNIRDEFTHLSKEHRTNFHECFLDFSKLNSKHHEASSTESFIDLERKRDRLKRLRVIQGYLEILSLKPVASVDFLDPRNILKDLNDLPKIPIEVIQPTSVDGVSTETTLRDIMSKLEKSILQAKINLMREKKKLIRIRAAKPDPITTLNSRLTALVTTRNELIKWIEAELARTSEHAIDSNEATSSDLICKGANSIGCDPSLLSIQERYREYVNLRQSLISCTNQDLEAITFGSNETAQKTEITAQPTASCASHLLYPYLQELVTHSNEQKSFVQQKTFLKSNITKQFNESSQGFDRLAQESHLLPTYPIPISESKRKDINGLASFGNEISSHEKQDLSHLAEAWVYAIEATNNETTEAVLEKLEEGGLLMLEVQSHLVKLLRLPGLENTSLLDHTLNYNWESINGNLGAIKGDLPNII